MIYLSVIVILLVAIIIMKDLTEGFKVKVLASIDNDGFFVRVTYLHPLIKISIVTQDNIPFIIAYVFNIRIYQSQLHASGGASGNFSPGRLLRSVHISKVKLSASYGWDDPGVVGSLFGAIRIIASFIHVDQFDLFPDFIGNQNYVKIDGDANFNAGYSIIDYVKNKA